ncbi:hypothetical protein [Pseudobacter ginsenosidimutans]|uniref:Uncharacterized protein n=1 Tax=Pseudobacter ginsenosidimutans TaxID=661488 RepID=A0A4Q7MM46_9BACT|nr:hypothetical protein [Pseudobacter ginsenosidimutans]QEC45669.1 hypothetical protein FSB84_29745 [Pseudobacter ginsenosidimutans]RZS69396.1 hypothetical protein EV199_5233 [Pseudobacter ginsenosidimutans]
MEPTIQHKLANLEIAPPQGGWELLSARLVTEYDQTEIRLAQTLNDTALTPPSGAWAAIATGLPSEEELITTPVQPAPARVVSFPFGKVAVAAAVLIVISFAGWFMLSSDNTTAPVAQTDAPPGNNVQAQPNAPSNSPNRITTPPAIAQEIPAERTRPLDVEQKEIENNTLITDVTEDNQPIDQDLPAAEPSLVRSQNLSTAAVSIPNRAYRDAAGKVVMDMNLLTTPGTQYVTVTAPNGEQTRISRKFLPVLTFINTGADNGQFNSSFKQKIQELRKQLLQQASFVPSAANFLDIMELKELLQDK